MKEADCWSSNLPNYTEVFIVTLLPSHKSTKNGQKWPVHHHLSPPPAEKKNK